MMNSPETDSIDIDKNRRLLNRYRFMAHEAMRIFEDWLPELLKHIGEQRSFEQYTEDCLRVWETQYRTGKLTLNVE